MSKRLFLVDGSGFIFRAFYGVRPLSTSEGTPTNAVYGFAQMMQKLLRDHQPTHVAVVFDTKEPTFRHEMYAEYKANRTEPPTELVPQFGLVRRLVDAFRWKRLEMPGYEADDIIGTLAERAKAGGYEVVIISSDKDLCQLLDANVRMLDTMKDKWTGSDDLAERFGGGPESVIDVLSLAGDTSDNIPGIPGVGEKTAVKLLKEFGSLQAVLDRADEIKGKLGEKVRAHKEDALLARRLVEVRRDMDLDLSLDDLQLQSPDVDALAALLGELEMSRLLQDIEASLPGAVEITSLSRDKYRLVLAEKDLTAMRDKMAAAGAFALDLETMAIDPMRAKIVGLSFCCDAEEAFYVPVRHGYLGVPEQIPLERALQILNPILEDPRLKKIGQNIKYDWIVYENAGVTLRGVDFDTMIASYLLSPELGTHNMDVLALRHLQHKTIGYSDVTGTGKNQVTFDKVTLDKALDYAAEDAHVTWHLWKALAPRIDEQGFATLFHDVEMPLVEVLKDVEREGVLLDAPLFDVLSKEADEKLRALEHDIHKAAGVEFNLNSPKQVSEVLFEKLGLPAGRKTKTGYSTDVGVLEKLADKHAVPRLMLDYRVFHKLKSTYIDMLPRMVNPETGRLHTSFNQTVAATGRLSSADPNLQNIPIRTPEGRRIREGFIAPKGHVLLSADYSQVELRILAHLSDDKNMIEAFRQGEDIHRATAAQVFGVSQADVTPEMRRQSKAINFGIVYGMSAFRLGQDLEIGTKKAQAFIDAYFGRFSGVKKFIDETIRRAKEEGSVTTIMGRRRPIPEIHSNDRNTAAFGERIAVNTPIQGSAADIIKAAMVTLHRRIRDEGRSLKMLLQVHDELVFEVPETGLEEASALAREVMEHVLELKVPLTVESSSGRNWAEAH
ncbi:MAG: DNA polymerase I [Deltaproteobacteria bacterium]|nr:DNA polymerase I [Deltaproteobacteria bacterium]